MRRLSDVFVFAAGLALFTITGVARAQVADIPPELRPWTSWVLHGHESRPCPQLPGREGRACAWAGILRLDLDAQGGTFQQSWTLLAPAAVSLPGDGDRWPLDVSAGGRRLAVLESAGVPIVHLPAGRHELTGRFEWSGQPESLAVPEAAFLLDVRIAGKAILPVRSGDRLVLDSGAHAITDADALSIAVHRHVADENPMLVTTRILLDVSGSPREIELGPTLPEGAIPVSLDSPLPARLDAASRLRVQLRAGSFVIQMRSRQPGRVTELVAPLAENWTSDEVWSFEAKPYLRIVSVEGVPSLDPAQTAIPDAWRSLPAFRVGRGDTVSFVEKQRGDEDPRPDSLHVHRALWLDFDGKGMSAQDRIEGGMFRSWRLAMLPPHELGHASVGVQDVVLTRLREGDPAGFEVRRGVVQVVAESRIAPRPGSLPAIGWDIEAESLQANLNLPPGWRLLHATGVDAASGSWIERWTLLDLFLALVIAAAALNLWGRAAGVLALATLVLTIPETGAPRWTWLVILALGGIESLLRNGGRARRVLGVLRMVFVIVLAILTVPFLVMLSRQALHPQLESPTGYSSGYWPRGERAMAGSRNMEVMVPSNTMPVDAEESISAPGKQVRSMGDMRMVSYLPGEIVQQGPGAPSWTWRSHHLRWDGPVARDQELRLMLQPPWITRLLSAASVALLCWLFLRALAPPGTQTREFLRLRRKAPATPPVAPAATAVAILLMLGLAPATRADFPSQQLLDDLRERLLATAPCGQACTSISRLVIETSGDTVRLRLQIEAAADGIVALPSGMPASTALLDGRPAGLFKSPSGLFALVPAGSHEFELAGVPDSDVLGISLPQRPARVELRLQGWTASGVRDGVAAGTVQLVRTRPLATGAAAGSSEERSGAAAAALPAFVRVTRTLQLHINWKIVTTVEVLAPSAVPILIAVPLVPGEGVTTAGIDVEDGSVLVNLAPGQDALSWTSTLEPVEVLELRAPADDTWSEEWRLSFSPRWHVEWSGIPPIVPTPTEGDRMPTWRPWPGETISLAISRPEAIPGSWMSFRSSHVSSQPGRRVVSRTLELAYSASQGGEHGITLPQGAQVQSLLQDGQPQPTRLEGRVLLLPILPGHHSITVQWRDEHVLRAFHRMPEIDLGAPSVNPHLDIQVPEHRWVLWTSGPLMGPAVLFWPLLAVLLLLALGLSRIRGTPLSVLDWLLLLVGLSQVPVVAGAFVVGWLLVLTWRRRRAEEAPAFVFDLGQVLIVIGALVSVGVLIAAINQGLLGRPDMQVAGNGSNGSFLAWTGDRSDGMLPRGFVLSAPLLVYRIAMLLWALWLAAALVRWMRWAWEAFTEGGAWRPLRRTRHERPAAAPPDQEPA